MKRTPEVERGDKVLVWTNRYVYHRFYRMNGHLYKMRCGKSFSRYYLSFGWTQDHKHCQNCETWNAGLQTGQIKPNL